MGVFFVERKKGYTIYTDGKVETFYLNNDEKFDLDELKTITKDLGHVGKFPGDYVLHFTTWNKRFGESFMVSCEQALLSAKEAKHVNVDDADADDEDNDEGGEDDIDHD